MEIRYAFRDDPLNVYLLSEGSTNQYTQIIALRKKAVAPASLNDYYYLDSRPTIITGKAPFAYEVIKRHWKNPFHYVAKVDCQLEIIPRMSVFEAIRSRFFPLWTAEANTSFLGDQPSGFLTVLRVYRVQDSLPEKYLLKGRQGPAQIMRLYDEIGEAAVVETELVAPVLSDGRFSYIKDELIYTLKKEGALIANYENTPDGRKLLQEQLDALRAISGPQERTYQFDPDSEVDYAQSDYSALYEEIKRCAPGMSTLVDYVASIKPPQFGEISVLHSPGYRGTPETRARMIEMHMRVALKCGMWLHKRYNFDLEEAVQTSFIGLQIAVDRFSEAPKNAFSSYAVMWMRQVSMRDLHGKANVYMPVHILERYSPIVEAAAKHICPDCAMGRYCDKMLDVALQTCGGNHLAAMSALNNILPPQSLEQLVDSDDVSDNGAFADEMLKAVEEDSLRLAIKKAMSGLDDRTRDITLRRFGFTGRIHTLEELAQEYGLTRERVRQIEGKALRKLGSVTNAKLLQPFWEDI